MVRFSTMFHPAALGALARTVSPGNAGFAHTAILAFSLLVGMKHACCLVSVGLQLVIRRTDRLLKASYTPAPAIPSHLPTNSNGQ